MSFAKVRANYAQVGNDVLPYNVFNSYTINPGFGDRASASNRATFNNSDIKSETTNETEFGFESQYLNGRIGLDISLYNKTTKDLITPLDIPTASGASNIYTNGGSVENKGIDLSLNGTPIQTNDFSWNLKFGTAKQI